MKMIDRKYQTNYSLTLILFCMLALLACGFSAHAEIMVNIVGPGGSASQSLPDAGGTFDLNMPLNRNAVNNIRVTAEDTNGNSASQELAITQVSLDAIVVSKVTSERLTVEQVEQLVNDGVIDLDDPENYNVSTFDIVLTIDKQPVPISIPIALPKEIKEEIGFENIKIPRGGGGSGGRPKTPPIQIVVFEQPVPSPSGPGSPAPPPIPGVIIIEGNIQSLKEFFNVRLLLMNTSGIFTLTDVTADIELPQGKLSNVLPKDGLIAFNDILPGDGDQPGQKEKEFIIRGDEMGIHDVKVNFGGTVTGPGIEEPIAFNGSATTEVEVKGPPTLQVQVIHPDVVSAGEPYELLVDITNTGELTAMYASLDLDVGADAQLASCTLDQNLDPVCEYIDGPSVRNFGHIEPGETVSESFTILPFSTGVISSCMAASDQNITLQVLVGNMGCIVGKYPPQQGVPSGIPTVNVVPAPNAVGISETSPVTAFFSERMNESSIRTGEDGSFNVFDSAGEIVPGALRFEILNRDTDLEKTVVIWQVNDGITNRFESDAEYTVIVTADIMDRDGEALFNPWQSAFKTTTSGINDVTPPTVTLSIAPPVNPNYVLPGEVIKINAYASDMGSGIGRVEMRIKDLDVPGATFALSGQKTVFAGDTPPYIFPVDSAKLIPGHGYQAMATAYDVMGNARNATLSLIIAASAVSPTVVLPDDPAEGLLQGISVSLTPTLSGGVNKVRYYLDNSTVPYKTITLHPFKAILSTLSLDLGSHTIRTVAEDGLGQTGEDTYTFTLVENINMPVVGFGPAVDGAQYITGQSILISGSADDPVGIASLQYFLDDPATAPIYTGSAPILLNTGNLLLGEHTIYLLATNKLGISNELNNPESSLSFAVVEAPPGPPPGAPVVTALSYPENGLVTVSGTTVPGSRVDITNSDLTIMISVYGNAGGVFSAKIPGDAGHVLHLVAYNFSTSPDPSEETLVTVQAAPVLDHITVSPDTLTFVSKNATQKITVTGHYEGGDTADLTSRAVFSSNHPDIASVNSSGTIVALSMGSALITASVDGHSSQTTVTNNIVKLTHITVDPAQVMLSFIGQTLGLSVTGHYNDGSSQVIGSNISFVTGNAGVVTVDSSGILTAKANGSSLVNVYTVGVPGVSVPVNVDTSQDTAPVIHILSPSDNTSVEKGDFVSVSVGATDTIGGVTGLFIETSGETLHSDTHQISPPAASVTQAFSFTVSNDAAVGGVIPVSVWAVDGSGNISNVAAISLPVVDETPPQVTIVEPIQQAPYNFGDTVDILVDAQDASGISEIRFETFGAISESDVETIPNATEAGVSFSFVVPYGLTDPNVEIYAYALDIHGNEGMAIPVDIILTDADITPPGTHVTSVSDPGSGTTAAVAYEITSGSEDLAYVALYFRKDGIGTFNRYTDALGGNAAGEYTPQNGATGTISFNSTRMGGDGTYEFYTVGVDRSDNPEPAPDDGSGNVVPDETQTFAAGTAWTVINTSVSIADGDTTYDNTNLRITGSGVVVTMDGSHSFHNMEILDGAVLTHSDTTLDEEFGLDIDAWTITIDGTSAIDVDEKGYLGGYRNGNDCTGQTDGNTDGAERRSGGSYGGLGGSYTGIPNDVYGDLITPIEPGSGGGCYDSSRPGGDGGGKIQIHAINVISDGSISSNGGPGHSYQAGSGSGGGIYLVVSTLSGTGSIRTNGGGHEVGGGGGRIAVHYLDLSTLDATLITSLGGQGSNADGGNGTVFLKNVSESNGTLVVDGQGTASAYSTLPIPAGYVFDNIIIRNNARVVADDALVVNDTLQVLTGSILTHSLSAENGLTIEAARVEVDNTSAIDVSSKGYRGGHRDGNTICEGLTLGGLPGSSYRSGGSYGGFGGDYSGSGINPAYGHPAEPVYLGSGGACYDNSRPGGNGGGRISITASSAVDIDGSILANGGSGHSYQAGSGSGGSIKIDTSLLSGTGTISANGGANEVGGGGGRVAIVYNYIDSAGDDLNGLYNITAFGGHGANRWGSAGTVVLKRSDQTYGDLYIDDNEAGTTSSAYTPLTHIGFGSIAELTTDTITTDGLVDMVPNGLAGLEINPNIRQSETFVILTNTEDTITVDTSGGTVLTDIASAGDTYAGTYRFDNVYFRRGGFMVLGDQMVVTDTLRIDEHGALTHFDATLDSKSHLELTVETLEITDTGSINTNQRGYLGGSRNGNDCTGQTEGNTDGATARSGGSFGGLGASYVGTPNPVYGNLTNPVNLGSGGGCYDSSRPGGDGGGWIKILANDMHIDGTISANGGAGHSFQAGSGSGGTVNVTTSTLSGTGVIQANGGAHEVGGGGGRIAVYYETLTFDQANFQVLGGQGSNSVGGNGTLYLKAAGQTHGNLVVDGLGLTTPGDTSPIPSGYVFDNIILRNNARVVADDTLLANDTLHVLNGSILTHSLSSEDGLTIEAGSVEVDQTSAIDASSKGYRGGHRDGNTICEGLTLGELAGASRRSGGSYGGFGGVFDGTGSNPPYGHPGNPVYLGSGGSCYDSSRPGGNGGGRITITASETIDIDGNILANGGSGHSYQAGSGSGGSIKIETSLLSGTGTISANGGANQVGGGGGRVAIVYDNVDTPGDDLNGFYNITAFGGHGTDRWGSAGTVVLRRSDQTYGDLYIDDNEAGTTSSAYTPLTHIGFGSIAELTTDTITTDGTFEMVPNGLAGLEINPNIRQSETFVILTNTEDTITVDTSGGNSTHRPCICR